MGESDGRWPKSVEPPQSSGGAAMSSENVVTLLVQLVRLLISILGLLTPKRGSKRRELREKE
jgi:hypothetical protein